MSLARGLERRLERLFDGFAARLFRGAVHPVELGNRLVREADLAVYQTEVGPAVPNSYRIELGAGAPDDTALHELEEELAHVVEETAAERGWRMEGPARVSVVPGAQPKGQMSVVAEVTPGKRPPWALLDRSDADAEDPVPIERNRSLVGRAGGVDCRLFGDSVSRRHALMWQEDGAAWVADLDSSNGTFVNGARIAAATEVGDGDIIAFGTDAYVLRIH